VHKDLKFRTAKETVDETWFAPHPFHGVAQGPAELRKMETADMASFDPFELLPEALIGVQLRGVGRQALQMEAFGGPMGQEFHDGMATMNRRALPDADHAARHLPQQVLETRDHVCRSDRAVLAVEVERALRGDGADGGEMVAGAPLPQDRRLAHRCIGAHDAGQGVDTRRIEEEERLLPRLGPFLSAGHVSSRQRAMAASSRCGARRIGC
jgi:hypothetical protein